jgi:iron complex transport system substrate-binding protein
MTPRSRIRRLLLVLGALVLVATACGDSDTSTAPPEPTTAPSDGTDSESDLGPDVDAAADAWAAVFDSEASFADKSAHLEDAAALESTIGAYAEAGSGLGGISLDPTAVTVDGDTATVTYDVLFGGTAAYEDQTGQLTRVDGVWTVARSEFCSFMASARTPCP